MSSDGRFYTRQGQVVEGAGLKQARELGLVPSVTTILQVLNKPGLNQWLARTNAEDAELARTQAAERGKAIHAAIAAALAGAESPDHAEIVLAVRHFLEERRWRVEASELSFAADDYAGTADLVVFDMQAEEYVIVDFKTGNYIGPDYFVQCAAYAEGLGRSGAALRILKIEDGQVYEHRPKMSYEEAIESFHFAKGLWYSAAGPGFRLRREAIA